MIASSPASILVLVNDERTITNFRLELIEKLIQEKLKIIICSPKGEQLRLLEAIGCSIANINFNRRGTNPVADLWLFIKYFFLIIKTNPNIILTYTIKPNIYGGIACTLLKKKQIATITGLGDAIEKNGSLQKILLRIYRFAVCGKTKVFFQNTRDLSFFLENRIIDSIQTEIVPGSGVNLEKFHYKKYPLDDNQNIRFVFIGRFLKDKGIAELLSAILICRDNRVKVSCDLIGSLDDRTLEESINKYVQSGAGKNIGISNKVPYLLAEYHAVVLPSYHEGMANVLLEAAACGRPVLASNIPGCRETFDEGISGYGFEPRSVDSLVQAIERFIALPYEEKAAMGLAGRKKMEREFDRQIVVDAYMREIENILEENDKKEKKK